jgi:hypothetical protein
METPTATPTKIWILRKGNGQLRAHPSPVVLSSGGTFTIRNLTSADATASFPSSIVAQGAKVSVPAGSTSGNLQVLPQRTPTYFEYDVTIGSEYAEGGSKPGGIVDP